MTGAPPSWRLVLYVSGASPRSAEAIETVRAICDLDLNGQAALEVIDVNEHRQKALEDNVLAVPTLIRQSPLPLRRLVGDLSDADRVRAGLDLASIRSGAREPPDQAERW